MSVERVSFPEECVVSTESSGPVSDRTTVSPFQFALLNQRIHEAGDPDHHLILSPLPLPVRRLGEELIEKGWLRVGGDERFRIPESLVFGVPDLGRRRDQILGCWNRLPGEAREKWLQILGITKDASAAPARLLIEKIGRREPDREQRSFLEELYDSGTWIPVEAIESFPRDPVDCYAQAERDSSTAARCIKQGLLLPSLDANGINGFYRRLSILSSSESMSTTRRETLSGDTGEWDRHPFGYVQQMKILLVLADAIPFRSTEDEYPYLFDIKEAARRTGWNVIHVHGLIRQALDWNFLQSDGERFYMTDRAESWLHGIDPRSALYHRLPLVWNEQQKDVNQWMEDLSGGRVMWSILDLLKNAGEDGLLVQDMVDRLRRSDAVRGHLAVMPGDGKDPGSSEGRVVNCGVRFLHWLGFVDVLRRDGTPAAVRINPRGQGLLSEPSGDRENNRDLPIILQPDGTVMVPITAPLEEFRRINPYVLLTDVDNMMQFKIDRQSLVKALNEGWDAASFLEFLSSRSDRIPDPVRELFEDVAEPAEEVDMTRVHHLLRFESGATASKAMRALRNYKPLRINDTEIILQSKTTEETIRRNLSRGGVRLKQPAGDARNASPLIEIETGEVS